MTIMNEYIDKIVTLSKDIESQDSIDWDSLNIDKDSIFRLMAMNVIEYLNCQEINGKIYYEADRDIMISTIIKLLVENFSLNLKLQEIKNGS